MLMVPCSMNLLIFANMTSHANMRLAHISSQYHIGLCRCNPILILDYHNGAAIYTCPMTVMFQRDCDAAHWIKTKWGLRRLTTQSNVTSTSACDLITWMNEVEEACSEDIS